MIRPLVQRLRRHAGFQTGLQTRVRKAVDAGVGVYNRTWPLGGPQGPAAPVLSPLVMDWCRFAMGQMRKPYGLDYVSLALAVVGARDRQLAQVNFGVLRPQEFYGDGGVAQRVQETLAQWEEQGLLSAGEGAPSGEEPRLAALLFSWGDLTRELLLAG